MRRLFTAATAVVTWVAATAALAQTVYPIDRAEMLVGARFDFKVEFSERVSSDRIKVTLNGVPIRRSSGRQRSTSNGRTARTSRLCSSATSRCRNPDVYRVAVTDGTHSRERHLECLRYRAAHCEKRDPVHRRRTIGRAPGRGAPARQGHDGRQGVRQTGDGRHAAHGAGRDRRDRFDHHRFRQFRQRLCHRPQERGQRHGGLPRPHRRPIRRSQGREHYQPGEAPARTGGRHRHQYRSRGRDAGSDGGAYTPPLHL